MAAAYFLFVPSGIALSVSLLPDAPMVMFMVMGLFAAIRYFERPSLVRCSAASILSIAAVFIKPVCVFPLAGGIIGLAMHGRGSAGWRKRVANGVTLLVATSTGAAYYVWHVVRGGELAVQADTSFVPALLLERSYWEGWVESAGWAVGFGPLIMAVLGLAAMRPGALRTAAIGLWGGYTVYCLLFTYHIRFAGHYHLLLVPIVALSLAPLVPPLVQFGLTIAASWFGRGLCAILLFLTVATTLQSIREAFYSSGQAESPRVAAAIGDLVGHSTRTVFLAPFYGAPLEYYGELAGEWWPRAQGEGVIHAAEDRARSVRERFEALGFRPEYFIVTDFAALRSHERELDAFLSENCALVAASPEYSIYMLRECLEAF